MALRLWPACDTPIFLNLSNLEGLLRQAFFFVEFPDLFVNIPVDRIARLLIIRTHTSKPAGQSWRRLHLACFSCLGRIPGFSARGPRASLGAPWMGAHSDRLLVTGEVIHGRNPYQSDVQYTTCIFVGGYSGLQRSRRSRGLSRIA